MPQELSGALDASGRSFGIVVARFNEFFTRRLMEGAVDALLRHGADEEQLAIVWVPGTWEIAPAVRAMALSGRFDAVIGLGLVIKGDTNHHELVAHEAAGGVAEAQRVSGVPCPLGIVSAENLDQATERCGSKAGNRGWDAAMAAMEMANLLPVLAAGAGSVNDTRSDDGSTVDSDYSESDATPAPRAKGPRPSRATRGAGTSGVTTRSSRASKKRKPSTR